MKRTPLNRSTKPLARSRINHKPAPPGFPEPVRMQARLRSGGVCEVGSEKCTGTAYHFHHRKLRRHKDHSLANCLYACPKCHQYIHAEVLLSYLMGWLVQEWLHPADVMVKRGKLYQHFHPPQH